MMYFRDPGSMEEGCGLTLSDAWEDGVLEYLTVEVIFKLSPER